MRPRSTRVPAIQRFQIRQYGLGPASTRTTGTSADLPVCIRVRSSNVSSIVPKPPGKSATPLASLTRKSLRVKKYLKVISLGSEAIHGFASCSNGRRMFSPKLFSPAAPSCAAPMIPAPAPVTTIQPSSVMRLPKSRALSVAASLEVARAEPKTVTLRTLAYGAHVLGVGDLGDQAVGGVVLELIAAGLGHDSEYTVTGRRVRTRRAGR